MPRLFSAVLLFLFITPLDAKGELLDSKIESVDGKTKFYYRWTDHADREHELAFEYDNEVLFEHYRHFKVLKPRVAMRHVLFEMQKATLDIDPRRLKVNFIPFPTSFEIRLQSREQELVDEWRQRLQEVHDQAKTEFLTEHYYNDFVDANGNPGIKPDHKRFAVESLPDLKPVVDAIKAKFNVNTPGRFFANFILSWLQNIPYSPLEDRIQTSGKGFSPPLKLLYNNQGDCDSKATLFAALMRGIFPKMSIRVIYLPGHALVGINIPHRDIDEYVRVDGLDFLLGEPTGPGLFPIADAAETSLQQINSGNFTSELLQTMVIAAP